MSTNSPPHETNKYLVFGQVPRRWTKKLEGDVPPIALQEGRNYFYAHSIDIRDSSREHAEAWVPGLTAKSVVQINVTTRCLHRARVRASEIIGVSARTFGASF